MSFFKIDRGARNMLYFKELVKVAFLIDTCGVQVTFQSSLLKYLS